MLAARSLAVVPVADDAPSDAGVAVGFRDVGDWSDGVGEEVESFAAEGLRAEGAFGAGEEVVGDVGEVAAVFVPGASGGDVVCCAFACGVCCQFGRVRERNRKQCGSPRTLISTERSSALPSCQGSKGWRSSRLLLFGEICTSMS